MSGIWSSDIGGGGPLGISGARPSSGFVVVVGDSMMIEPNDVVSASMTITVSAANRTFTRAAGDWTATNVFTVGHKVRFVGFAAPYDGMNDRIYTISALTTTVLTVAESTGLVDATSQANIYAHESFQGFGGKVALDLGATHLQLYSQSGAAMEALGPRWVGSKPITSQSSGVSTLNRMGQLQPGDTIVSMVGYNDMRKFGANWTQWAHHNVNMVLRSMICFACLPAAKKVEGGDRAASAAVNSALTQISGTWSVQSLGSWSAQEAAFSNTSGASISGVVSGDVVVVSFEQRATANTYLNINVDGTDFRVALGDRWPTITGAATGTHQTIIIPGCGAGQHTVTLTREAASGFVYLWYIGGFTPGDVLCNVYVLGTPYMIESVAADVDGDVVGSVGSYTTTATAAFAHAAGTVVPTVTWGDATVNAAADTLPVSGFTGHSLVDKYNDCLKKLIDELRGYGFPVEYIDLAGFDPKLDSVIQNETDDVHWNAYGVNQVSRLVKQRHGTRLVL